MGIPCQSHHPTGDSLSPVYLVGCAPLHGAWIAALLGTHLEVPVNKLPDVTGQGPIIYPCSGLPSEFEVCISAVELRFE